MYWGKSGAKLRTQTGGHSQKRRSREEGGEVTQEQEVGKKKERKKGVSGVGDRVTGRRGELVGVQGVLSARWLVRNSGSKKNGNEQSFPPFL